MFTFSKTSGVDTLYIESDSFNTTGISVNFYLPLKGTDIAATALVPYILTSCGKNYPDFLALNRKLLTLYGTELKGGAEKIGDGLIIRFYASALNDGIMEKNSIGAAAELLTDLLFNPKAENGAFCTEDFLREKRLTEEKVKSLVNDKKELASVNAQKIMFAGEDYAVLRTGELKDIKKLTETRVYEAYKNMLYSSAVRIQVVGNNPHTDIVKGIAEKLNEVNANRPDYFDTKLSPINEPITKYDSAPISQSKLVLGFKAKEKIPPENSAVLSMFSDILGGGTYSKLFSVVREEKSLCYYCGARATRPKGYLLIQSGVDDGNLIKAKDEILYQFSLMQKGEFSEKVMESSAKSLCDSLRALPDSLEGLDAFYSMRPTLKYTVDEQIENVKNTKKEEIVKMANCFTLSVIYAIRPEVQNG